MSYHQHDLVKA